MKTLHLSTSDIDNGGARAAYRLHKGLEEIGCESQMLVRAKFSSDQTVSSEQSFLTKLGPPSSDFPLQFYPLCNTEMFSAQWFPDVLGKRVNQINPNIINIHWICNGYIQIETFAKFQKPLIWTLHDMWPFTGGCHYVQNCKQYEANCGRCPQLQSNHSLDLSSWILKRKAKSFEKANLTIVATSNWMADCARASSLFKNNPIKVIPLGLDTRKYKPLNRQFARDLLNLPQNKQLILFGAISPTDNQRKGFQLLSSALQILAQQEWSEHLEVVVFGSTAPKNQINLGLKAHYMGYVRDDLLLAVIYSAADVMMVPSTQEAFGQTAIEAMSCGIPVIAFNATGLMDIVTHQVNGYLATPFNVRDLAYGITWVLADQERYQNLSINARNSCVRRFSLETQAHQYLSLYEDILEIQLKADKYR